MEDSPADQVGKETGSLPPFCWFSDDENEGCGFAKTGSGHDEGRLKTNKWRFLAAALAGRQAFPLHEEGAGRGDDGAQQVRQEKNEKTPCLSLFFLLSSLH